MCNATSLHSIDCPDDGYGCVRNLENKEIRSEMAVTNHNEKCNQYIEKNAFRRLERVLFKEIKIKSH